MRKWDILVPLILALILITVLYPVAGGRAWTDAFGHYAALSKTMDGVDGLHPASMRQSTLYAFTRPLFLLAQNYVSYEILGIALFCGLIVVGSYAIFFIARLLGFETLESATVVLAIGLIESGKLLPRLTVFEYGHFFTSDTGFTPRAVSTSLLFLSLYFFMRQRRWCFLLANALAFVFHPAHGLIFNAALTLASVIMLKISGRKYWLWMMLCLTFAYASLIALLSREFSAGSATLSQRLLYSAYVYSRAPYLSILFPAKRTWIVLVWLAASQSPFVYLTVHRRIVPEGSAQHWQVLAFVSAASVAICGIHVINDIWPRDYRVLQIGSFRNVFVSIFALLLFYGFVAKRLLAAGAERLARRPIHGAQANLIRQGATLLLFGVTLVGLAIIGIERQEFSLQSQSSSQQLEAYQDLFGSEMVLAPPYWRDFTTIRNVVNFRAVPFETTGLTEWVRRMDRLTDGYFLSVASQNAQRGLLEQPLFIPPEQWNERYFNLSQATVESIARDYAAAYILTKSRYDLPLVAEINRPGDNTIYYVYRMED